MNQAKIDWLHRLGIDVWRLRKTDNPNPNSASRLPKSVAERAQETIHNVDDRFDENKSKALPKQPRTESSVFEPLASKTQPIHSPKEDIDADHLSFKLQCLSVGNCLMVFNADAERLSEMALGIGNAVSKYESSSYQRLDFEWPPMSSLDLPNVESHGGWESARRAFNSLIKRQGWTSNILVTVGSDANKVTELLRNSEYTVLKIDDFPASAQSKKELWHRIQEIL